ncbi:Transcriptional regulator [Tenacibaculum sp. 190130A14a]|uniref:Transcriptional regulator n=1 Tax=Tenacibaculum polynesiense TaxID=3137857 RepID=A0ABM9P6K0_9FLAO
MLRTIQIVAILQGIFLLFILSQRKKVYKKVNFWLLFAAISSVILFVIGDDDYNLFVKNSNWFLFHEPLIITFFFLLVRYYKSDKDSFANNDFLFFLPYILNLLLNFSEEVPILADHMIILIFDGLLEFVFMGMILYTLYDIVKRKKESWLLFFIAPLAFVFIIGEFTYFITNSHDTPYFLESYGLILTSIFLFYLVLYKLIITPKDVLPQVGGCKYKSSNLNELSITHLKTAIHHLIVEKKWYRNQKLTVNEVAKELGVPRQQISEVLNVHMQTGFQDFLNKYRVEEFIICLQNETYKSYTLLAIANEVGFSSKSSFNTTFKKLTGITPSQYKKELMLS